MNNSSKISEGDIVYAALKAGLGSIPILGSAATELYGLIATPPLDKRRQEWMNDVAESLECLEEQNKVDYNGLSTNEIFLDTIIQATSFAIKTSETEKIKAFSNAVVNTALDENSDRTKNQIFLNLIDSFTDWHIKILTFLIILNFGLKVRGRPLRI